MKKLVLSLVVSFGLSVSANALDMCIYYQNAMVDKVDDAKKALKLGLNKEALDNQYYAYYYAKQSMITCKENSESFKSAKYVYDILKVSYEK